MQTESKKGIVEPMTMITHSVNKTANHEYKMVLNDEQKQTTKAEQSTRKTVHTRQRPSLFHNVLGMQSRIGIHTEQHQYAYRFMFTALEF